MIYTIQKLGELAGISTRTIRYYDEIDLLKPASLSEAGYRMYGSAEVNRLQQILFYRELGISLGQIKEILISPGFDRTVALKEHKEKLIQKRAQLDLLINNVDKSIQEYERGIKMTDKEKFEGFKQELVDNNEDMYGEEIRNNYGNNVIDQSNAILKNMTKEHYEDVVNLEQDVLDSLKEAIAAGDPTSKLGQKTAELHKQWISFHWPNYSKEVHAGLAEMYVADERFQAYYDKVQPGAAQFLRDAIVEYTKN
ncbi:MerR family transcriptional regulator [Psychrobacillus sp. FSL W7-1493]|uniref:MerR family transcriptional regulator n=1 Tax=Psychrobacillus sp. FSL W7-1493 TaxID=2921552 RepID=UPI0030FB3DBA